MNKKHLFYLTPLFLFSLPLFSQIQNSTLPPLVAANGFSCVKTQMMVNCKGRFPGVGGTFSASGAHQVNIVYETPDLPGNRFSFDSSTGCVMRVSFNRAGQSSEVTVWNSTGTPKNFMMPLQQAEASHYCQGK